MSVDDPGDVLFCRTLVVLVGAGVVGIDVSDILVCGSWSIIMNHMFSDVEALIIWMDIVFVFPLSLVMFTGRTFGFVIGFSDMNLSRFDPSSLRHDVSDMAACMEFVASVMITDNLYLCTTDIC